MNWTSLMAGSDVSKLLTQYPDKKVLKSLMLLSPEERPTVPVRTTDDYRQQYRELGARIKMKGAALPEAFTTPMRDMIYVNRQTPGYDDTGRLAANLAHEAYHVSDKSADLEPTREYKARQRELGVLERLNGRQYRNQADEIRLRYGIK